MMSKSRRNRGLEAISARMEPNVQTASARGECFDEGRQGK